MTLGAWSRTQIKLNGQLLEWQIILFVWLKKSNFRIDHFKTTPKRKSPTAFKSRCHGQYSVGWKSIYWPYFSQPFNNLEIVWFSGCINHPLESINHLQYPWWMYALVYVEQCLYPRFLGYKIGKASSGAHYDQRPRPQEDIEDWRKIQPRISYEYTISKDRPGDFGGSILLPLAVTPG